MPLVSVVIPTRARPALVPLAARSALGQTLRDLEVVVVLDGPDPATREALERVGDDRLRLVELPASHGVAAARNAGVADARAPWVAFLDDDDLWLPAKLERQLEAAGADEEPAPVVACRVLARNERGDHLWPRRLPGPGEPLAEYLYCRRSPFAGEGLLQPSMLLAPTCLLREEPFDERLHHLEDHEWLLRATLSGKARVVFPTGDEPLAVWSIEDSRVRASYGRDWKEFVVWAREHASLLTPRSHVAFVLGWAGHKAARSRSWGAFPELLREALRTGPPSAADLLTFLGYWLVPPGLSARLALAFARRKVTA